MIKEFALKNIHWQIAQDPWTQAVFEPAGIQYDVHAQRIVDIFNFEDFDKLPLKYIEIYELWLGIPADDTKSLADRRAYIQAMWMKSAPATKVAIQSVCDAWMNGECIVTAGTNYVQITFASEIGVPTDINSLKSALAHVLPAHLQVIYDFKYLLIRDVHDVMTLTEMEATPLGHFAG